MGPKTRGVFHRSVSVGLEVVYKEFVGNDASFLESLYPLPDPNVDVATRVRYREEGVFKDNHVWGVFEMDPHVLEVRH